MAEQREELGRVGKSLLVGCVAKQKDIAEAYLCAFHFDYATGLLIEIDEWEIWLRGALLRISGRWRRCVVTATKKLESPSGSWGPLYP